jgi:putative oxidoreductase
MTVNDLGDSMFNFDLTDGYVALRILVGLFLLPHAWGKVATPQGPLGFFTACELPRPALFMRVAFVVEVIAGIALVLGIWTQLAACVAAAFLLGATLATLKVSKRSWFWMAGGCEYPLFWGLCCVIVALHA